MNAGFIILMFGGPAVALIASLAYLIPHLRPRRLGFTLAVLGAAFSIPVVIGFITNSGYPLLILRPGTVFLGLLAASAYFVISHRHRLPSRHLLAAIAITVGSIWDGISLCIMMNPGFGGAYCYTILLQDEQEHCSEPSWAAEFARQSAHAFAQVGR